MVVFDGNIMGYNVVNLIVNHPQKRFIFGYAPIWGDVA